MRVAVMMISAVLASPAAAQQPITNAEFVARAEPILKKSMASLMFSSEAKKLMRALDTAAKAARAKQEADRAAGRRSAMCLPPQGKAKIDARQLIAYLKSLPPAEQSRSLEEGFASYAARKYPCPKA